MRFVVVYYVLLVGGLSAMLVEDGGWLAALTYYLGMPLGAALVWYHAHRNLAIPAFQRYRHLLGDGVIGCAGAAAAVAGVFGALYALGWVSAGSFSLGILVWIGAQQVVVATIEELAFRGVLQQFLTRAYGLSRGLIITAVLFGLFHLPNILFQEVPAAHIPLTLINLTLMGWLFGWAMQRTGEHVWLPLALHLGWNTASFGLVDAATLDFSGPSWLTGSSTWFPESGLSGMLGLVCVGLLIWGLTRDRR
ncbi:MAG: CPBP family intramembrane metalloprotease [Chloroflexi bacterium]|nr:CPBP family intramembrane metalloprotease [Chloroflexota bacterium]